MQDQRADSSRLLWVLSDRQLVAMSSLADHGDYTLPNIAAALTELGALPADETTGEYRDFAFVDQLDGIARPCPWLIFERSRRGVTSVRFIPDGDLPVSTPEGWDPDNAAYLLDPEGVAGINDSALTVPKNRLNPWLGNRSGRRLPAASGESPLAFDLHQAVAAELRRREWQFETDDAASITTFKVDCGPLMQLPIRISAHDTEHTIRLIVFIPGHVQRSRRGAASEYLLRVNWGLWTGGFDMDWSDGEVSFRGTLTPVTDLRAMETLALLLDYSLGIVRRYAGGLLRVAQGATPAQIVGEIEGEQHPRSSEE